MSNTYPQPDKKSKLTEHAKLVLSVLGGVAGAMFFGDPEAFGELSPEDK